MVKVEFLELESPSSQGKERGRPVLAPPEEASEQERAPRSSGRAKMMHKLLM